MSVAEDMELRWIGQSIKNLEQIDAIIAAPILAPQHSWRWWATLVVSGTLTLVMIATVTWLFGHGIGIFGNNTTIVWGFPIANYVWWLGIGHAGTLISALLLLTRQKWRASLNRFAETMTLFAASMAGLFPIFHLGRPYYVYWIIPYPNVQGLWPQWRSALVWDFWAVGTYITFSALFWYVGLVPDLAMLRERAVNRGARRLYGAFALGWRGSARHWEVYERFYRYMAALAVRWWFRCIASSASISPQVSSPAGRTRSTRPISSSAPSIPGLPWLSSSRRSCAGHARSNRSSRCNISKRSQKCCSPHRW